MAGLQDQNGHEEPIRGRRRKCIDAPSAEQGRSAGLASALRAAALQAGRQGDAFHRHVGAAVRTDRDGRVEEDVPGDVSQQGRCRFRADGGDSGQEWHGTCQEGLWREQATKDRGGAPPTSQAPRSHVSVCTTEIPQQA